MSSHSKNMSFSLNHLLNIELHENYADKIKSKHRKTSLLIQETPT